MSASFNSKILFQNSEREQKRILKESLRRLQSETAKQNTSFAVPSSKDVAPNCVGHQPPPPPPAKSGDERQPLQTKNGAGKAFDYKKYEEGSSSLASEQNRKNCHAIKIGSAIKILHLV